MKYLAIVMPLLFSSCSTDALRDGGAGLAAAFGERVEWRIGIFRTPDGWWSFPFSAKGRPPQDVNPYGK